jgi:WD40 repeat protein
MLPADYSMNRGVQGDYLAASLANGTVVVLDLAMDCARATTLTKTAPAADVKQLTNNAVAWSPDGAYLAVPGRSAASTSTTGAPFYRPPPAYDEHTRVCLSLRRG